MSKDPDAKPANEAASKRWFKAFMNVGIANYWRKRWGTRPPEVKNRELPKLDLSCFELKRMVGQGMTSTVFHATLKPEVKEELATTHPDVFPPSGDCCLKVMNKAHIVSIQQIRQVLAERAALHSVQSAYIIQFYGTFQDGNMLYLVLEYMDAGDLQNFLETQPNNRLSLPGAKYILSQVLLGLDALHNDGYVYRDLKPENILLGSGGEVKLVDLGFVKNLKQVSNGRAMTKCGTPEYLAPEILLNKGCTRAADYWAFGILLHEILIGYPPVKTATEFAPADPDACDLYRFDHEKHKRAISDAIRSWPSWLSDNDCHNLCKGLLVSDEDKRIGMSSAGVGEIKKHPFFNSIDWSLLAKARPIGHGSLLPLGIDPPFTPPLLEDPNPMPHKYYVALIRDTAEAENEIADVGYIPEDMFKDY